MARRWSVLRILTVIAVATITAVPWSGASPDNASPDNASPDNAQVVYVNKSGTAYHRAECPRVHFARTLSLEQARLDYSPCAVCMAGGWQPPVAPPPPVAAAEDVAKGTPTVAPKPAAGTEATAPAVGKLESDTNATSRPVVEEKHPGKKRGGYGRAAHIVIGAGIGFAAGAIIGYVTWSDQGDPGEALLRSEATLIMGTVGMAIGAVVGAVIPVRKNIDDIAERALEEGRKTIRGAMRDAHASAEAGTLVVVGRPTQELSALRAQTE